MALLSNVGSSSMILAFSHSWETRLDREGHSVPQLSQPGLSSDLPLYQLKILNPLSLPILAFIDLIVSGLHLCDDTLHLLVSMAIYR